MAARPLILPEPFNGVTSWTEWTYHFENVATVNEWDDADKLKWLKVRLTGRAQTAFQHLPETTKGDFKLAFAALKKRFEPTSRKGRYQAEFRTKRKTKSEGWAEYAEDLRKLVSQAYPELGEDAKEQLALHNFLDQLQDPLVAFNVKQKTPTTLDEAVSATLLMETYRGQGQQGVAAVADADTDAGEDNPVSAVEHKGLATLLERLVERVERLETRAASTSTFDSSAPNSGRSQTTTGRHFPPAPSDPRRFSRTCWHCGRRGHIARNCPQRTGQQPHQRQQDF